MYLKDLLKRIQTIKDLAIYVGESDGGIARVRLGREITPFSGGIDLYTPNAKIIDVGEDHIIFRLRDSGGDFKCIKIVPFARLNIESFIKNILD